MQVYLYLLLSGKESLCKEIQLGSECFEVVQVLARPLAIQKQISE